MRLHLLDGLARIPAVHRSRARRAQLDRDPDPDRQDPCAGRRLCAAAGQFNETEIAYLTLLIGAINSGTGCRSAFGPCIRSKHRRRPDLRTGCGERASPAPASQPSLSRGAIRESPPGLRAWPTLRTSCLRLGAVVATMDSRVATASWHRHDLGNLIQIATSAINIVARTPEMPAIHAGPVLAPREGVAGACRCDRAGRPLPHPGPWCDEQRRGRMSSTRSRD